MQPVLFCMGPIASWPCDCGEQLCACRSGLSRGSKDGLAYLDDIVNGLVELAAPLPEGGLLL